MRTWLFLIFINLYHRVATVKTGPTITSFLKKVQQQMGVAIVGFAAYRDEDGKLCTFEYITLPHLQSSFVKLRSNSYSFHSKDLRKENFSTAHSQDIEQFLGKWGKWVSQNGIEYCSIFFYLLTFVLGVGSIKPNGRGDDDDDEDSKKLAGNDWLNLLDLDEGVYSLKPFEEVLEVEANKVEIGLAFREIMRQAWSECHPTVNIHFSLSDFGYLEQSGRKGKITWRKIDKNPLSLIHPRFLLETKIEDPTRMKLDDLKAYWEAWVSEEAKGHPFSFLSGKEKDEDEEDEDEDEGKGKGKGQDQNQVGSEDEDQNQDQEEPHSTINKPSTPSSSALKINYGIPLPCQCDTPTERTICLQGLAPKDSDTGQAFHALVKLVDSLKVSFLPIYDFYYISYYFRIQMPQVASKNPNGHSLNGHGKTSTFLREFMETAIPLMVF